MEVACDNRHDSATIAKNGDAFSARGYLHCLLTLQHYLPGLDPGLTALGAKEALLAEPTWLALQRAYGRSERSSVLQQAGVLSSVPISQTETLRRLRDRDAASLPVRASAPADRGWHLDEVNVRQAWAQHWGGPDAIDWSGVKVGQIDTGYTEHPVFGFGAG